MKKIVISIGILTGVVIVVLALKSNILLVKQVECYTQFGACDESYLQKAKFLLGRPIYIPLPKQQITSQFSGEPAISDVSVYRRLPSTVVLGITLRRPVAAVLGTSVEIGVVDEQGVVFETADRTALPTISIGEDVSVGSKLSPNQVVATQMLGKVGSILQIPIKGHLEGNSLIIDLPNSNKVILDVGDVRPDWEASLQSIWARSKIDGKFPRKIDLRFTSPAVSF